MAFGRWLIVLLVLATSSAVAAEPDWKIATTPHYRLLSQASERETTAWMRGFDQFILSTSDVLKINLQTLPPLTIVLFDRDKDYDPYKLQRPDGKIVTIYYFAEQPHLERTILATIWAAPERVTR